MNKTNGIISYLHTRGYVKHPYLVANNKDEIEIDAVMGEVKKKAEEFYRYVEEKYPSAADVVKRFLAFLHTPRFPVPEKMLKDEVKRASEKFKVDKEIIGKMIMLDNYFRLKELKELKSGGYNIESVKKELEQVPVEEIARKYGEAKTVAACVLKRMIYLEKKKRITTLSKAMEVEKEKRIDFLSDEIVETLKKLENLDVLFLDSFLIYLDENPEEGKKKARILSKIADDEDLVVFFDFYYRSVPTEELEGMIDIISKNKSILRVIDVYARNGYDFLLNKEYRANFVKWGKAGVFEGVPDDILETAIFLAAAIDYGTISIEEFKEALKNAQKKDISKVSPYFYVFFDPIGRDKTAFYDFSGPKVHYAKEFFLRNSEEESVFDFRLRNNNGAFEVLWGNKTFLWVRAKKFKRKLEFEKRSFEVKLEYIAEEGAYKGSISAYYYKKIPWKDFPMAVLKYLRN